MIRRDLDGAFHDFVMTEGPSLYRLARLLSEDSAAAEDLVQVALLRAWKSWPRVCAAEDRAAYVRRILVNAARTGWRRRWRLESPSGMISAPSAHDAYQQVDDRHLPHVVAGESCPITPGASSTDPYVFGQQYGGGGPVWMVLGDRGDPSRGTSVLGNPETPGWLAAENVWLVAPGYQGPFTVRGMRLDGRGTVGFGGTPTSAVFVEPPAPGPNSSNGWRFPPGAIWVTSPGCYGFQIDGTSFSETVVIDMQPPSAG